MCLAFLAYTPKQDVSTCYSVESYLYNSESPFFTDLNLTPVRYTWNCEMKAGNFQLHHQRFKLIRKAFNTTTQRSNNFYIISFSYDGYVYLERTLDGVNWNESAILAAESLIDGVPQMSGCLKQSGSGYPVSCETFYNTVMGAGLWPISFVRTMRNRNSRRSSK